MKISINLKGAKLSNGRQKVIYAISNGRKSRTQIVTDLEVNKKHWNKKKKRVTARHPNDIDINVQLRIMEDNCDMLMNDFKYGNKSEYAIIQELKRTSDITSLDAYIESYIKTEKSDTTYVNYKDKLNSFKSFMNIKRPLEFKDIDNVLFARFKRIAEDSIRQGKLRPRTCSEYAKNIIYICNQAYENEAIPEPIQIKKKHYSFKGQFSENIANSKEDIYQAIGNIETLAQWQAVAFWLLMVCFRGFYPADISKLTDKMLQDKKLRSLENKNFKEGWINFARSKTNEPMFIRLFPDTAKLLKRLKTTLVYTHIDNRIDNKNILKGVEDRISLLNYDHRENYKKSRQLWNYWSKQLKQISDNSITFKKARKSFLQTAEVEFGRENAKKMVGHKLDRVATDFYSNYRTPDMIDKIDKMHRTTLKDFSMPLLISALLIKLLEVQDNNNIPDWVICNGGVMEGMKVNIPNIEEPLVLKYVGAETPPKYLKYFIDEKELTDALPYEDERKEIMSLDIAKKGQIRLIKKMKALLLKEKKEQERKQNMPEEFIVEDDLENPIAQEPVVFKNLGI